MGVSVSKEGVPNVSLVPVQDCPNSELCRYKCYALKAWRMYSNVRKAWQANSFLAKNDRAAYFSMIFEYLAKKAPSHFRWHVAGEIQDQDYLDRMIRICQNFPGTKFLVFTKMHKLNYSRKPQNLSVVFSRWPGDGELKTEMPQAWMQDGFELRAPDDAFVCPLDGECTHCWDVEPGDNVILPVH